jgi:hypothetical protein
MLDDVTPVFFGARIAGGIQLIQGEVYERRYPFRDSKNEAAHAYRS